MTFLELALFYLEGISELAKIEGITYRDGDQIQENPGGGIADLSTIQFVYKDLKNSKTVSFITSRAGAVILPAAYRLSSIDKKLRDWDLELVKEELQFSWIARAR